MGSKPSVIAEMCQESLLQMGWGWGGVRGILLHYKDDRGKRSQKGEKMLWVKGETKNDEIPYEVKRGTLRQNSCFGLVWFG